MVGALGYPFALLGRRPFSTIIGFLLFVAILIAIDLAFEAGGADVVHAEITDSSARSESFVSGFASIFTGAMVMATAAIDLKRRDAEERPSPVDGFAQILVNIKYSFTIMLPTVVLGFAALALWQVNQWGAIAAGSVVALAWVYVTVRLFIAWPMAAVDGSGQLWRAWPLSRAKFWPLLGLLILIYAIGFAAPFSAGIAIALLPIMPAGPVTGIDAALQPGALAVFAVTNTAAAFLTFYTSAAVTALYNAVDPSKTNVADEF